MTMAADCSRLRSLVYDLDELQTLIISRIDPWTTHLRSVTEALGLYTSDSSLEATVGILREIRRKSRLRDDAD